MQIIKESQRSVSKENPQKMLFYAVGEIHLDDSKTKMSVYIRTENNYKRIVGVLKKIYAIKNKYLAFPEVPFNTECYSGTKCFIFEKDIKSALELLVSMNTMSKVTYKEALSHLKVKKACRVSM